jgi:hypothetical protein
MTAEEDIKILNIHTKKEFITALFIFQYIIQQDATLHSLFISGNRSTCFGCYFHPSSGAHTTVSTASGICHKVLLPAAIVEELEMF